ncbi:hypothetical protein PIB30_005729 [Stylosanthes scabra]|uniref:Ubiquitin-like protease family profile domain-containing protein n=1 Tax=Stylosanthes scabra TaxID=79078 RepID=A0ABU6V349_9FABA|nr:hypothetical protein [Stylosanthes scabra]
MEPKSYIDIGIVGLMCHVLNREEADRYEKLVYCLPPEILVFAPVLYLDHWWLYVLDKTIPEMFVQDSKNISSPTDERTTLNKFGSNILNQLLKWDGAPSILKKGSWSLPTRYINVPQQPNNYDCAVFVMKWMV